MLIYKNIDVSTEDLDDPLLISKKFWFHLKSFSKSTRIPESVFYGTRFRNNSKDQAELFNQFFCDQFSESSSYDIDVNFVNDDDINIDFSHDRIRQLLRRVKVQKAHGPDYFHGKVLKN